MVRNNSNLILKAISCENETNVGILRQELGMFVSALVGVVLIAPQPLDLLARSKPIASTKEWLHLMDLPPVHDWIDQDHIAFPINDEDQTNYRILDIRTGKSSVAGFSVAFNETKGNFLSLYFSPSGKEVLWGSDAKWYVASLDGSNRREFNQKAKKGDDTEVHLRWSGDGKSLIEWRFDPYLPGKTQCWQRMASSIRSEHELPKPTHDVTWMPEIRGNGKVITTEDVMMGPERQTQHFVSWSLQSPKASRFKVRVPANRTVSTFMISPDGKQILWNLSVYSNNKVVPWNPSGEEIWVSDLAGKKWQLQGNVKFASEKDSQSMTRAKWRPDQKSFSFSYRERLYVTPIKK